MQSPPKKTLQFKPTQMLGPGEVAAVVQPSEIASESHGKCEYRLTRSDLHLEDLSGFALGAYDLGKRVGHGGMGLVYAATHRHLQRQVAIKFVHTDNGLNRELEARFLEEVRAVGRLQNAHIVQASDAGAIDGLQYLVTELLQGDDLNVQVQESGTAPIPAAFEIIRQACLGLSHAHECGFVHRDIKPSNLFYTKQGQLKLLDFGLVRQTQCDSSLTNQGCFMGTLDYIAPEQADDASRVTPQCDIYSLGCTLIFLLTGEPPFPDRTHPTPIMKLRGHLTELPSWEQRLDSSITKDIRFVINRMIAKNPEERFKSCDEIVEAIGPIADQKSLDEWSLKRLSGIQDKSLSRSNLDIIQSGTSIPKPHWAGSVAAAIAICVLGIAYFLADQAQRSPNVEGFSVRVVGDDSTESTLRDANQEAKQETKVSRNSLEPSRKSDRRDIVDTGREQSKDALVTSINIPIGRGIIRSESTRTTKSKIE